MGFNRKNYGKTCGLNLDALPHIHTWRPRIYDNNDATHDWSDVIADEFRSALAKYQKLKSLRIEYSSIHNPLAAIYYPRS